MSVLIKGGTIVNADQSFGADVLCKDGRILAIGKKLEIPKGTKVIDASGQFVMPGGIDPHTHMAHPFMTPDGQTLYTQGPDRVGQAALWGGTR